MMTPADAPAIILRAHPGAPPGAITAFAHGCEEMRVPLRIIIEDGAASDLAERAAQESPLGVGAGIDDHGWLGIAVARQGSPCLVLHCAQPDAALCRLAGSDAGRLVLELPLRALAACAAGQERGSSGGGMLKRRETRGD